MKKFTSCIAAILLGISFEGNAQVTDIALASITPVAGTAHFVASSTSLSFGGTITNTGTTTITSFTATYQVGSGPAVASVFSGLSIPAAGSYPFTCTTPYTPASLDSLPVTLWVTAAGDTTFTNDTLMTSVTGVSHFPVKKLVTEEATAAWCDACPRGIIYLDSFAKLMRDTVSYIAVHMDEPATVSEPMALPVYGSWIMGMVSSYPSIVIDRKVVDDPLDLSLEYDLHKNDFGYADMALHSTVSGDTATVVVTVTPATNLPGVCKLAMVLTEDKVHNGTPDIYWNQANLYSGGASGPMQDSEYNFALLPSSVPDSVMYYDHVARLNVPYNPYQLTGTYFPTPMTAGVPYSYTFTAPLDAWWNVANMHAVVLFIDSVTGHVMNSGNVMLGGGTTYAHGVTAKAQNITIYPNPVSTLLNITGDENITSIVINDLLGHAVLSQNCNSRKVQVDVTDLPAGVYFVKINNTDVRKFVKE